MNNAIYFMIRLIMNSLLLMLIYKEAGLWTMVGFLLIAIGFEVDTYHMKLMIQKVDQLELQIKRIRDVSVRNHEEIAEEIENVIQQLNKKRPGWMDPNASPIQKPITPSRPKGHE